MTQSQGEKFSSFPPYSEEMLYGKLPICATFYGTRAWDLQMDLAKEDRKCLKKLWPIIKKTREEDKTEVTHLSMDLKWVPLPEDYR